VAARTSTPFEPLGASCSSNQPAAAAVWWALVELARSEVEPDAGRHVEGSSAAIAVALVGHARR